MAYKFQLGSAKLGGSVTSTGTISGSVVDSQGALSGASIQIDDASGIAGDALEDNGAGSLRIAAGGVTNAMLSGAIEGSKIADGAIGNTQLSGNIAADKLALGDGLDSAAGALTVQVDDSSVQVNGSNQLEIKAGGVTNAMLSGAIDADKLRLGGTVESSGGELDVKFGAGLDADGVSGLIIAAGGVTNSMLSGAIAADKLKIDTNHFIANVNNEQLEINFNASGGVTVKPTTGLEVKVAASGALQVDGSGLDLKSTITGSRTFSNDVTVNGNFTVLGSTFSASVGTLIIEDALINVGDGSSAFAQDYGIQFGSAGSEWASLKTDSDAGFNNLSSSLPLLAPALATDDWSITSTHISGNLPVSASAFYGDGSGLTGISATTVKLSHGIIDSSAGGTANINTKVTVTDSNSQAITLTLPSISPSDKGTMYIVKRKGSNNVTITSAASSQLIEFLDQDIVLETDGAAVTLLASENGLSGSWIIV